MEGASTVSRRAARTPNIRWAVRVGDENLRGWLASSFDRVYISVEDTVTGLDRNGVSVMTFRTPSREPISAPTIASRDLLVVSDKKATYGLDQAGRLKWTNRSSSHSAGEFIVMGPAAIAPNGMIVAAGIDGILRGLAAASGRSVWEVSIGTYAAMVPAVVEAISSRSIVVMARNNLSGVARVEALDLQATPPSHQFHLGLGKGEPSSIVAGKGLGIAVSEYKETTSRRGATAITVYDVEGRRLWSIDRGRHDTPLLVTEARQLIVASQDSAGVTLNTTLESWNYDGKINASVEVGGSVSFAVLGEDGGVYSIACLSEKALVEYFDEKLRQRGELDLGHGCVRSVTYSPGGDLYVARVHGSTNASDPPGSEVIAISTPSKAAAKSGWAMPRGDSRGSGTF